MTDPSFPAPTSSPAHLRSLRWILFGVMVLTAVLVAVAGRPPAAPVDSSPAGGFIGAEQQGTFPGPLSR